MPAEGEPEIPERIGGYRVLDRIGRGGMAELFVGRTTGQAGFEKLVAIKRILPHLAADVDTIQMFLDEARISARLVHPNVAQIFDLGSSDGTHYIAMEYVHGVSLVAILEHLQQQERLAPTALTAYLVEKTCAALAHAHARRDEQGAPLHIVHRDVSPSNVLCSFEGDVKLIDFGIAKAAQRVQHTRTGLIKGKLSYMSPEQVRALPVDHRSDIFAAGTLLFELLTGVNPFRADSDAGTLERVRQAEAPPPSALVPQIPRALDAVCLRAMSIAPEDRYPDAGQMEHELARLRRQDPYDRRHLAGWLSRALPGQRRRGEALLRRAEQGTAAAHETPSAPRLASDEVLDETNIYAPYPPAEDPDDFHGGPTALRPLVAPREQGSAGGHTPSLAAGEEAASPNAAARGGSRVAPWALAVAAVALAGVIAGVALSMLSREANLPPPRPAPAAKFRAPAARTPDAATDLPPPDRATGRPPDAAARAPDARPSARRRRRNSGRRRRRARPRRHRRATPQARPMALDAAPRSSPGVAPLPYPKL